MEISNGGKNKVCFVDVDGVLNWAYCDARCGGFIGISGSKLKLLKQIVDATRAKIVLTSTWKIDYEKYMEDPFLYSSGAGKYLREKFRSHNLKIFDTTTRYETNIAHRGEGIHNYVKENNVGSFVILDDDIFDDYEEYGLMPYLVKSKWCDEKTHQGGLNEELVAQAIEILNCRVNN